MSDEIKVNYSVFEEVISSLTSDLASFNQTIKTFKSSSEAMKKEWLGSGADAYKATCDLINSKLDKAFKDLEQEITDLIGSQRSIVKEDDLMAKKFNSK